MVAKVSIIVPVYNAEKVISRCLNYLINQTYKNIEIICVNDGSKDNSLQILNEYEQKDNRIVVLNQKNFGVAKARNFGISKMTGKYLMFCDADDFYELNMVEKMVSVIETQNVDFAFCNVNRIDFLTNKIKNNLIDKNVLGFNNIVKENFSKYQYELWNKIFKKQLIDEYNITYPVKYEHDDVIFFIKYFICSKFSYGIEENLYNYYFNDSESLMGKIHQCKNFAHEFDFIFVFDGLYDFLKKNTDEKTVQYFINFQFNMFKYYYDNLFFKNRLKAIFYYFKQVYKNRIYEVMKKILLFIFKNIFCIRKINKNHNIYKVLTIFYMDIIIREYN